MSDGSGIASETDLTGLSLAHFFCAASVRLHKASPMRAKDFIRVILVVGS